MRLSEFDFHLPEGLIATRPASPRSASRLLVAEGDAIRDLHVRDLPDLLGPGDRLILNDTKVIPGRLDGIRHRQTGQGAVAARVEITLLAPLPDGGWRALAKPGRKLQINDVIDFGRGLEARVLGKPDGEVVLGFDLQGAEFDAALEAVGNMPLPPYIAALRPVDARDKTDYQTVFARSRGAVAAPTASLHFDADLLARLAARGVAFSHVTLHVGAGTFLPVKVDDVSQHRMHAEWGEVTPEAAEAINRTRAAGGRVIPVGTTALRLIESAAGDDGVVRPFRGETDIFIRPGYQFRVTDGLMTNFHLPKSTLLMLVAALMGKARIDAIYAHAVSRRYRFFSYGDASLLLPESARASRKAAEPVVSGHDPGPSTG
ncbi:MAG: tRNA preQ1(34) S-adenosylmethionine ribosyltransferase-isomerase QueA [Rhodobacteraceae bacterium]|nr:tRNA preQ1(34) S-adenosylmethionine ribosyltransferase-isomerase QueA [Paracoccaceae bacterium]